MKTTIAKIRIILFVYLLTLVGYSNSAKCATYFIDPSQASNGSGTFSNPYKTLPAISANNTYLFKAGTTYNISGTISVYADNVCLGSYGAGAKPKIYNSSNTRSTIKFQGRNCKLSGLMVEMYANVPNGNDATGSGTGNVALLWDTYGTKRPYSLTIDNCVLRGGKPAVDAHGCNSVRVLNCDIANAVYDAHWSDKMDTVIYKNTWIHDMYLNEKNYNLVISIDLIHVKHCFKMVVDNCILDHTDTPGKYCIIHHRDDNTTYARDSLIVSNTELRGSRNSLNYGACVKPSVHYSGFVNCIFTDAIRHMQDVSEKLDVDNCLFRTVIPISSQILGIQKNSFANIRNSTFVGMKSPYNSDQATTNCIFWNCSDNGNYSNSTANPLFDSDYNATATSLVGAGYVSTGTDSPDVTMPSATTGLIFKNITETGFSLSWSKSTDDKGVVGYDIYGNGVLIASAITNAATLTDLVKDAAYSIIIKARDASGYVSDAGEELLVTTNTTGIANEIMASPFTVYPNPAHDYIHVDVGEKSTIKIMDISGKVITAGIIEHGISKIKLDVEPGNYIVEIVNSKKQISTSKIIIK